MLNKIKSFIKACFDPDSLTCPTCGYKSKSERGIRQHRRMIKH